MSQVQKTTGGRSPAKIVGISVGALLLVATATIAIGWIVLGDTVPKGTSVAGVDISGLSSEQAAQKLEERLNPELSKVIVLEAAGKKAELDRVKIGFKVDYKETVTRANGHSFNPVKLFQSMLGGGPVELVTSVDEGRLKAAVQELAPTFASSAKNATISFEGAKVVRTQSTDEVALLVDPTVAKIKDSLSKPGGSVQAVTESKRPAITTEKADEVVKSYAEPAVSGPVEVTTDGGAFKITPEMIAAATTFAEEGDHLVPSTSSDKLIELLGPTLDGLKFPKPKDATFSFADGHPVIVPSVDGLSLDPAKISSDVLPLLTRTADRRVQLGLVKATPKLTTADAEKLGVKEVTGEWTTYFPDTAYRNNNLPKAAAALNGTVVKPGETFSFNKVVGQRTVERGYMAGGAICPGNKICQQLGGGVSQVATTTFNAFFFSGLKHISHQPHTLYFDRYPAGRESTIDWGHIDVSFYNDSPYAVYLEGVGVPGSGGNRGSVTIKVWSTKEYDVKSTDLVRTNPTSGRLVESSEPGCAPQTGQPGFTVNYKREWYKGGNLVRSEPYSWTYASTDTIVCKTP